MEWCEHGTLTAWIQKNVCGRKSQSDRLSAHSQLRRFAKHICEVVSGWSLSFLGPRIETCCANRRNSTVAQMSQSAMSIACSAVMLHPNWRPPAHHRRKQRTDSTLRFDLDADKDSCTRNHRHAMKCTVGYKWQGRNNCEYNNNPENDSMDMFQLREDWPCQERLQSGRRRCKRQPAVPRWQGSRRQDRRGERYHVFESVGAASWPTVQPRVKVQFEDKFVEVST